MTFNDDNDFTLLSSLFDMAQSFGSLGDAIGSQVVTAVGEREAEAGDRDYDRHMQCDGEGCEECGGTGHGEFRPVTGGAAQYVDERVSRKLQQFVEDLDDCGISELREQVNNFVACIKDAR